MTVSSGICVLLVGGFVGLSLDDIDRNLAFVGDNVLEGRKERIRNQLRYAAEQRGNSVSALAAMINFDSKTPDQVFNDAVQRFRCVSWDDLTYDVFVRGEAC